MSQPNERLLAILAVPLFIPLKTEYYNAFLDGSKVDEYRLYGKRWNEKVCVPGRRVTISKGYGKLNRRSGEILFFSKDTFDNMPAWLQKDIFNCYGEAAKGKTLAVIRLKINRW